MVTFRKKRSDLPCYALKLTIVSSFFKDRNLDWFPRLRAMSLAADESEGEQMELRSLQAQLEVTQTLVQHLSQQLTELRDQVKRTLIVLLRGHSLNW